MIINLSPTQRPQNGDASLAYFDEPPVVEAAPNGYGLSLIVSDPESIAVVQVTRANMQRDSEVLLRDAVVCQLSALPHPQANESHCDLLDRGARAMVEAELADFAAE